MYLGIEIGGTKLQLGLGAGDGALAGLQRAVIDPAKGADGIRRQITEALPALLSRAAIDRSQLCGVGIGFGGPVDDATRTVIKSHQIEGWDHFPLADWIGALVGLPAALGNDADVAGLAEALFGSGRGLSPIFYITIGSGIGGGLIIDGEIYRGCGRGAAEIGHLVIDGAHVTEAGAFNGKILEHLASGWAIEQRARDAVWNSQPPALLYLSVANDDKLPAQLVGQAAAAGDAVAQEILHAAWTRLAMGICHVITLICPRRIIIGGGVSLMGERLLFEPLRRLVAERVFRPFAGCYDIVPAALGEEVVVHGALALARKQVG